MFNPIRKLKNRRWRVALAAAAVLLAASSAAIAICYFRQDIGFFLARQRMVWQDIKARGVEDKNVLAAMRRVPRHKFVPEAEQALAYADQPVSVGFNQPASQPFIVACMTELLKLTPNDKVLEIATSSGYHTAVLAKIAKEVYTVQIVKELAATAEQRLHDLGCTNVHMCIGDGFLGWQEHAPYDAILVRGAVTDIPPALAEQLKPGGRMVLPLGASTLQSLTLIEKRDDGTIDQTDVMSVRFTRLLHPGEAAVPPQLHDHRSLLRSRTKPTPADNAR